MELVTPGWVTALRGIGVVCNIYNMAKVSDNVIEGLEENWNKIYTRIQAFFKNKKIGELYFEVEE